MIAQAYPNFAQIRIDRLAARRSAALHALAQADAIVRAAGGSLRIFGSLAEGGFDERSDLDVALFGLARERDSDIAGEIDTLLALSGFEADIVLERFLSGSLRERVTRSGRELGDLG